MKLSSIIGHKLVAVLALIPAVYNILPYENTFILRDIWIGILWLVGALFTWKKKTWAAVLLAMLAAYDLIGNFMTCVRTLRSDAHDFSLEFDLSESLVFAVGFIIYFMLTVMMICIIYHGIVMVMKSRNLEDGSSS
ncbi:hypothetical protein ES703_83451 [subsurface metagenome]